MGNETHIVHGTEILTVIEQYFPAKDKADRVLALMQEGNKLFHGTKGLLSIQLLSPSKEGEAVINISTWESKEAMNQGLKSEKAQVFLQSEKVKELQSSCDDMKFVMQNVVDGWHP